MNWAKEEKKWGSSSLGNNNENLLFHSKYLLQQISFYSSFTPRSSASCWFEWKENMNSAENANSIWVLWDIRCCFFFLPCLLHPFSMYFLRICFLWRSPPPTTFIKVASHHKITFLSEKLTNLFYWWNILCAISLKLLACLFIKKSKLDGTSTALV